VVVLFFYSTLFYFFGDLGICFCHNKLISELGSLFCGMATAKFEVKKFDGHNSFSLWRIKMRALLRQQGLAKVLEPKEKRIGITTIDEIVERRELEEKAHIIILLSLSDGVLREVVDEETTVRLWKKVRKFVHEEIPP
jgi:hypothetical protein